MRRAGQIPKERPQPAADVAPAVTAAGGKPRGLYDLPHIGVIGDGQAEEVGILHVIGPVPGLLHILKMVQAHGVIQPISPGEQGAAPAAAQVGPLVRRGQGEALLFQLAQKVRIVHPMVEGGLPAVPIPFKAGVTHQGQAVPSGQGELPKLLQPLWAQAGIVHCDLLPAEFFQLSAHQHGANSCLPNGSHAFPDHLLWVLFHLPFLEQVVQFLLAVLIQPNREPFPAQGNGIAGNEDILPAIFLKYIGGAALAPAVKGL